MIAMGKNIRYPDVVCRRVEAKIPPEIIEVLTSKGWNFLGIYELVGEELKKYKKELKNVNDKKENS